MVLKRPYVYKYTTRIKCMYCDEVIEGAEPHEGVEFINGYPAPCRKTGTVPYIAENEKIETWQYCQVKEKIIW